MAKSKAKPQENELPKQVKRASVDRYEIREVHRSQLLNAPYNPRTLSDKARAALKRNLKKVGLTHPPVWNQRTGFLVSGHQRIAITDSIEGTGDYMIRVAVVDMDDKTEKEQNVFENNGLAQGDWDAEKLESLFRDDKIDFEAAGFDTGDIMKMFGQDPVIAQPERLIELADKIREVTEQNKRNVSNADDRDEVHYYLVAVFRSHARREAFTKRFGLPDERFVDGEWLATKLGASGEEPDSGADTMAQQEAL